MFSQICNQQDIPIKTIHTVLPHSLLLASPFANADLPMRQGSQPSSSRRPARGRRWPMCCPLCTSYWPPTLKATRSWENPGRDFHWVTGWNCLHVACCGRLFLWVSVFRFFTGISQRLRIYDLGFKPGFENTGLFCHGDFDFSWFFDTLGIPNIPKISTKRWPWCDNVECHMCHSSSCFGN